MTAAAKVEQDMSGATSLDALRASADAAFAYWLHLIQVMPPVFRSREQVELMNSAREVSLAARNDYWEAKGNYEPV